MAASLFSLGQLVATPGALALVAGAGANPAELLTRHQAGDYSGAGGEEARRRARRVDLDVQVLRGWLADLGEKKMTSSGRIRYMENGEQLATFALDYRSEAVGRSRIVLADCFEWLGRVPEASLHAVVTDPPYGVKEYKVEEIEHRGFLMYPYVLRT